MHQNGIFPSGFTFSSVLNACGRVPAIFEGKQVHARVVHSGFLGNKVVKTALLDMYAKFGCVLDARDVFDGMVERDVVAWMAMICGYAKARMMVDARWLFDNMGERNTFTWTTMVVGYANCGDMKATKELYDVMSGKDEVTWVAMIVGYGKLGNVSEARRVFDGILEPQDASTCVAMLACYAQNGYAKEAIEMYGKMRQAKIKITEVAMVGAISACAQLRDIKVSNILTYHLDEGCCDKTHIVSNALIHIHSKCGNIQSHKRHATSADATTWDSLLAACRVYANLELGETAAKHLFKIDPKDSGNYVLLANTYASKAKWERAEEVKMLMSKKGMKKPSGYSWIQREIRGQYKEEALCSLVSAS